MRVETNIENINDFKYYFIKYKEMWNGMKITSYESIRGVNKDEEHIIEISEYFEITEEEYDKSDLWVRNGAGKQKYDELKNRRISEEKI